MSGSVVTTSPGGVAIPAGNIVSVLPSVLSAGGTGLDLIGLLLVNDTHIPLGQVYKFSDLISVQAFFGVQSYVAALAGVYFLADINATKRPGQLKVACYHLNQWVSAKLMSKQMPSLTAAQLQAGYCQAGSKFTISMDGNPHTTATNNAGAGITFSAANAGSLSMAAQAIGASLNYTFQPNNTTHGVKAANLNASCSGTVLTVTNNNNSVPIQVGDVLAQPNPALPAIAKGTYIMSAASTNPAGGLTGSFNLNNAHTFTTVSGLDLYRNCCSWDANTSQFIIQTANNGNAGSYPSPFVPSIGFPSNPINNLVTQLGLTQATGAILNPLGNSSFAGGVAMTSIAGYMDNILKVTQDWATFATAFDPDGANGATGSNSGKQQFAAWANSTNQKDNYMYVCWDNDANAVGQNTVSANTIGQILNNNLTSGTCPIYSPVPAAGIRNNGPYLACFTMGVVAATDFERLNGRKTLAFRGQTGMPIDITSGVTATNLESNFYNYYGSWTTANDHFEFIYPGLVSGPFKWVDSYVNQIWMNNGFQQALMVLLTQVGSIPYNQAGYTLIKAACQDVINKALKFGAIRTGVTLSELQKIEVNNAAGVEIDGILNQVGWFLQVQDVTDTQVRAARETPVCTFWYMDGGSVQRITLASIMIQ